MSSNVFIKDPNATLDYGFDWSQWLDNGETISDYVIDTSPCGIVNLYSTSTITGSVVAWLTSGCVGTRYSIACKMTTSASRVDERTIKIDVKER
jgi:hypothetical protein